MDAITVFKETVMHYNLKRSDVYCVLVDPSKAYDRINISLLCDKMRETDLPGQVIELIDFISKNSFGCTSYVRQLSDDWKVKNRVRQGGISSGKLFKFCLKEVISAISKLPAGCTLNCSKVNINFFQKKNRERF